MNQHESPLYWSIPCGTWYETRVRVSIFFLLLAGIICYRLEDPKLGLLFSAILLVSVLLHEFGHVVMARMTHGSGNEIFIWPWGGFATVQPGGTLQSRILTPAAGPLVNAVVCAIAAWPVMHDGWRPELLNPLVFPSTVGASMLLQILVLTFWINWILFLINLIPVYPLDGGRIVHALLASRFGTEASTDLYLRIGFIVGILGMLAGLLFNNIWLVTIGSLVLILNLNEVVQLRTADGYDESFMGYDFSQGYTSLERAEAAGKPRRAGFFQRWKEKRLAERRRRHQEKDAEVQQQLDVLLQKVHASGIESLTEDERRQLKRASAHLREKDHKDG
jgi:Zn-dependent protease